jgi:hypothetical protein
MGASDGSEVAAKLAKLVYVRLALGGLQKLDVGVV